MAFLEAVEGVQGEVFGSRGGKREEEGSEGEKNDEEGTEGEKTEEAWGEGEKERATEVLAYLGDGACLVCFVWVFLAFLSSTHFILPSSFPQPHLASLNSPR